MRTRNQSGRFRIFLALGLPWAWAGIGLADEPAGGSGKFAPQLAIAISLEDGATAPLQLTLSGPTMAVKIQTWRGIEPGNVDLALPEIKPEHYWLEVSTPGYSSQLIRLELTRDGELKAPAAIELYRNRYVVLRYAINTVGNRELVGADVKEGRVAIAFGTVPDLGGDWLIRQNGETPRFQLHRIGNNGFAAVPADWSYDELKTAPQPDQYRPAPVEAEKGLLLFAHILGDDSNNDHYAKILVEDVTENPPAEVQRIDKMLAPTRFTKRAVKPAEGPPLGTVAVAINLEDNALQPVELKLTNAQRKIFKTWRADKPGEIEVDLPALDNDRYTLTASAKGYTPQQHELQVSEQGVTLTDPLFDLYRVRYVIFRYSVNVKGERNLTGANVKERHVAIAFGSLPELGDWTVRQEQGEVKAFVIRRAPKTGFARPVEDAKFESFEQAPEPDDYAPDEFTFEKGMILFNRVVGHRPEMERFAKLLVEDVTEAPPKGVPIVDSRRN